MCANYSNNSIWEQNGENKIVFQFEYLLKLAFRDQYKTVFVTALFVPDDVIILRIGTVIQVFHGFSAVRLNKLFNK